MTFLTLSFFDERSQLGQILLEFDLASQQSNATQPKFIDTFDIMVQIKENLMAELIFGLKSRTATGTILGFLGYRH